MIEIQSQYAKTAYDTHFSEISTKHRPWLTALLARRPTKVAAIALANKLAAEHRIVPSTSRPFTWSACDAGLDIAK
jgi:hypothetical protein